MSPPTLRWKIATTAYWVCCFSGSLVGFTFAGWLGGALWLGGTSSALFYANICVREALATGHLRREHRE